MNKIILLILLINSAFAQKALTVVAIGEAEAVKESVLIEKLYTEGSFLQSEIDQIEKNLDIVRNDLRFYQNFFHIVPRKISNNSFNVFDYDEYASRQLNYIIRVQATKGPSKKSLIVNIGSVAKREVISKYELSLTNTRLDAHRIADHFYKAVVGKAPIFLDKIVFVSDQHSRTGSKDLYIMDFDGANIKRLTRHNGLVISPSVSPDGTKVLYSLIDETKKKRKNINLRLLDLKTGRSKIISKMKGINSGAVFTSDGQSVILTLSHQGNAELYKMSLPSGSLQRLTKNRAPDVDPSISSDGSLLAFLSARAGKPMIYTMVPSMIENKVKRISYVGQFNATPRFSPDGGEIVFSSWLDNRFDLFRINSDGSGLGRLTKDFGSNEDPIYSKDGQFIVFTNQRVLTRTKAVQNLYIMDRDGKVLGPLSENFGKCISPRWLKSL